MRPGTPEGVRDLLDAPVTSAAVAAALELGLFWILDEPLPLADIAERLGIPAGRCRYWLQLLVQSGLVDEGRGGFRTSGEARDAVLRTVARDTWAFLALEARERYPVGLDLARTLRGHSPFASETRDGQHYVALMSADPERAQRFTRMLYELHRPLAEAIAGRFDMTGVSRLIDVGGGSGVVSMALARQHPGLKAVVVDIGNVCEAGRKIAEENALGDRVSYWPADLSTDALPRGFDFAIMCDVGVHDELLFRRIQTSLNDDGRFGVVDDFAPAPGVAPASRVSWAFARSIADPGYQVPTADDVSRMLEAAGFRLIRREELYARHDRDTFTILEATKDAG